MRAMTQAGESLNDGVQVDFAWPAGAAQGAKVVNQFLLADGAPTGTGGPDGVYLLVGHLAPPIWRSPEEARKILNENGGRLRIEQHGTFHLSRARLEELYDVVGRHLGKHQ
jgi:hypothetical protein